MVNLRYIKLSDITANSGCVDGEDLLAQSDDVSVKDAIYIAGCKLCPGDRE